MRVLDSEYMAEVRKRILTLVSTQRGLKTVDLLNIVAPEFTAMTDPDFMRVIHELVQASQLIRIEYQIPHQSTIYSFYLPGQSKIL